MSKADELIKSLREQSVDKYCTTRNELWLALSEVQKVLQELAEHYEQEKLKEKLDMVEWFYSVVERFDTTAEEYYPTIKALDELKQQLKENEGG